MSKRIDRRERMLRPEDKPLKAFFIPHGPWDADLLQEPYEEADRMLTDNPGKRVAVFTENISGVDFVARSATEAVLHGDSALDALVRAEYRRFSKRGRVKPGVSEAQFTALYKEGVEADPFNSKITQGIDDLNEKHPGRVLWIGEGMDEDTVRQFDNKELRQNYFGVPLLTATGTTSFEDFAATKTGEMRRVGALHRDRDDKLKKDVHGAFRRKDVVGGVLWRGSYHQHVGQELRDEGLHVEITTEYGFRVNDVALYSPDKQLFREMMADPTRPVSEEEFDLVIQGTFMYDGWDQRTLRRVNSWVEGKKAEAGIETLGQRELIVVKNALKDTSTFASHGTRTIEINALNSREPGVGDSTRASISSHEAAPSGEIILHGNQQRKSK